MFRRPSLEDWLQQQPHVNQVVRLDSRSPTHHRKPGFVAHWICSSTKHYIWKQHIKLSASTIRVPSACLICSIHPILYHSWLGNNNVFILPNACHEGKPCIFKPHTSRLSDTCMGWRTGIDGRRVHTPTQPKSPRRNGKYKVSRFAVCVTFDQ